MREDTAFTNSKGAEKRGIRKRAEKALEKLQEPLRKFLEPDEAVLYIARSQIMPGSVEQFFMGAYSYYLAPGMLILTNRRLLHILVARDGRWKRSLRSARWGDVEEAKVKGLLGAKLHIKYRDGKTEIYWGMIRDDAKKIQLLLETLIPSSAGETSPTLSMTNLCPECRTALTPGVYECPNCRLKFKDEGTAVRRALLIPGGGFFYTGHPFLGIIHLLTDTVLFLVTAYWGLAAMGIIKPTPDPGEAPVDTASAFVIAAIFVGLLAAHKWVMIRITKSLVRNYLPAS